MKTAWAIAIVVLILSSAALGASAEKLPFIQDDYLNAIKQARQNHLPVFVEVWAPW